MTLRRLLWGAIGAAIVLLGIAGYAIFIYPRQVAQTAVSEALGALPAGWSATYGKVDHGFLKDQLVIHDLSLTHEEAQISIASLVLTGFNRDPSRPAAFQIGELSVTAFSYRRGQNQVSFRTANGTDVAGDFAAAAQTTMANGADPMGVLALPVLVSARRSTINDVRTVWNDRTDTIDRITATEFGHGEIATLGLENWYVEDAGGTGNLGTLSLTSLNTEGLRRLLDPANEIPPHKSSGEIRSLLGRLVWSGFQLGSTDTKIRFQTLTLEGLRGQPFSLAGYDVGLTDPGFAATLAAALTFDSFDLDALEVTQHDDSGVAKLQSLHLTGFDRGKLAKFQATNLNARNDAPPAEAELGSLEIHDADFGPWIRRLQAAGGALPIFDPVQDIGALPYIDVTNLTISHGPAAPLRLDSLHCETTYEEDKPIATTAVLTGGSLPIETLHLNAERGAIFRDLQLSKLGVDLEAAFHWHLPEHRIEIDNFHITLDGLGAVGLTASLDNVDPLQPTTGQLLDAIQQSRFEHLTLHYTDASLVGRILAARAQSAGRPTEQFRDSLIQQMNATADQMREQPDSATTIRQLAELLKQPKSVAATLSPTSAVSLESAFAMPLAAMPRALGIHIVSE